MSTDRTLLAALGDEDTVTGLLLAGIGQVTSDTEPNFAVVTSETSHQTILDKFNQFTTRDDIAIVLINQHVADQIRQEVDAYDKAFPAVLEIPSKDHPYDPERDSVLRRVRRLFGE